MEDPELTAEEACALDAVLAELAGAPLPPAEPRLLASVAADAGAVAAARARARRPRLAGLLAAAAAVGLVLGASGLLDLAGRAEAPDVADLDLLAQDATVAALLDEEGW
jgi:hypothetical protein